MLPIANAIEEIAGLDPQSLSDELLTRTQPAVFRGLVSSWPVARAGRESARATDAYLRRFYKDATVSAMLGAPDIGGRLFYSDDLAGFNFKAVRIRLYAVLDEIARQSKSEIPPAIYVGSSLFVLGSLVALGDWSVLMAAGWFALALLLHHLVVAPRLR